MSTSLKQSILQEPSDRKAMIGFGFSLFWDNIRVFALVNGIGALIMSLPALVASDYLLGGLMGDQRSIKQLTIQGMTNNDWIIASVYIVLSIVIMLYLIAFNVIHTRRIIDGSSDIQGSWNQTTQQRWPIIATMIVSGFLIYLPLIILGGVSALIILLDPRATMRLGPIWGLSFFIWAFYAIKKGFDWMFEFIVPVYHPDLVTIKALDYSKQIVSAKRRTIFWNIVGYVVIFSLVTNLLIGLLGAGLNLILADVVHPLTIILTNMFTTIVLPLLAVTGFVVYFLRLDAVYQSKKVLHAKSEQASPIHHHTPQNQPKADHSAHHAQHDHHRDLDDAKTTESIG